MTVGFSLQDSVFLLQGLSQKCLEYYQIILYLIPLF